VIGVILCSSAAVQADWKVISDQEKQILSLKPNMEHGFQLYDDHCIQCHELEAWGSPDGEFPELAGQHTTVLLKQMLDMLDKRRSIPEMKKVLAIKELSQQQALADLMAYITTLPMSPDNGQGKGTSLEMGRKLYQGRCKTCHGEKAEGKAEKAYPRLQAQHFRYMLRQIQNVKAGKRINGHPKMEKLVNEMSAEEIYAVLDYTSHLKPPQEKDSAASYLTDVLQTLQQN